MKPTVARAIAVACLVLSSTGCTPHWDVVETISQNCTNYEYKRAFACRYQARFSLTNDDLMRCETRDECNAYCQKVSGQ